MSNSGTRSVSLIFLGVSVESNRDRNSTTYSTEKKNRAIDRSIISRDELGDVYRDRGKYFAQREL